MPPTGSYNYLNDLLEANDLQSRLHDGNNPDSRRSACAGGRGVERHIG
jgi:hypothetical protein